jgi:membrane-associated phospholipid phosphatase
MESVLQWGLNFIRQIQSHANPPLTGFMLGITWLGSTTAYLLLLPLIYWCIDEKRGFKLGLAILISAWLNLSFKYLLNQPRPFFPGYDPSVGMIPERLGGFPSGHAQNALVMWIIIASWTKRKWPFIAASLIVLLVSFSRIYLGVHFPTDILGGWALGGLVLCGWFTLKDRLELLLENAGQRAQMITAAAVSFIMILYRPDEALLMPGGILLGMGAGFLLNRRFIGFKSPPPFAGTGPAKFLILAARFVLGIAVTALIFTIMQKIIPLFRGGSSFLIVYFALFGLIGLWVSAGAPWLFCTARLAKRGEKI